MTIVPHQLRVGSAEVYLSGSVTCRPGQVVEIAPVAPPSTYRLRISFVEEPGAPGGWTLTKQPDSGVLVTFTNLGPSPAGNIKPIHVGNVGDVPLLLDIVSHAAGAEDSSVRAIIYTVTLGQP
jgi:hypothetical protein